MAPCRRRCRSLGTPRSPNTAFLAERPDAARRHLVTPDEEVMHAVIQMGLDHAIRNVAGSRTEVAAPSLARGGSVHRIPAPWPFVAGTRIAPGLALRRCRFLSDGDCPVNAPALLPVARRAEAATQKVKRLRPCVAQQGLRSVQAQPETRHHTIGPGQCLSAFPPAMRVPPSPPFVSTGLRELRISGTVSGERFVPRHLTNAITCGISAHRWREILQ